MVKLKDPLVVSDILPKDELEALKSILRASKVDARDEGRSRGFIGHGSLPVLSEYALKLLPLAQEVFESETLKPTYTLYCIYEGASSSLNMHKDDNACTYTLDFCLDQSIPWAIIVEDKEYVLQENEALAFFGNDQEHGRPGFPGNESDHVAMIFFHYAEPDHWYFTKGPEYLKTIQETDQS